ncbi:MAG: hypothetical protein HS117_09465 [Verrucomicrobiaceae bacterium]|nr:hypothetical protein [Verrucomicrobiaceae bacterium]
MIEEFQLISDYCTRAGKSLEVRNHAFCLFVSALDNALKEHADRTGNQPKPKEAADKHDALLTEDSVLGFVTRAEHLVEKAASEIREPYKDSIGSKQFWMSVWAGVLASLIYSIIILIVFWVAREQIASWLQSVAPAQAH